ncbi:PpiC-type peptidyl-prolyl cis-trans isomerase [Paenibacillus curdlanolyticus YK9]|uniref:PpiC-type peptidyl-prolyl cis-trans isomerase n=1 Tax=Paenibacillus curdlanolyticus YK9 TaxID=717606 RepID=E0I947_9BACL|nr:peptidylprolyl isomerase [Paenibacillus curdlanolyticus]EFM10931.1 PpiC-type peptidyl-prolyl cis-trans isomerase [Paenibacillus curdlanolyticus YK9]
MLHNKQQRSRSGRRGFIAALVLLLALSVALAACGKKTDDTKAPASGEGKVIAEYKDGTVTDKEFDRYLGFFSLVNEQAEMYLTVPSMKEQFLREYIGYKVLYSRVDEKSKDSSKEEVDKFVDQFKQTADSNAEMKAKMEKSGLTVDNAAWYYRMIVSVMDHSEQNVKDADMKAIYDKAPSDFNNITVRHILIGFKDPSTGKEKLSKADALKKAQEVKQKLEAGGDWAALAKQYSDDEGSKDKGGLYENQEPRVWVEAFKKAANTQEIGKIGDPVETEYGYHVMKVEKRETRTWEQVPQATKDELRKSASTTVLNDFMTKELPGLITKVDLPKEETTGTKEGGTDAGKDAGTDSGAATEKKEETK